VCAVRKMVHVCLSFMLVLIVFLAGCSSNETTSKKSSKDDEKKQTSNDGTVLRFATWDAGKNLKIQQQIAKKFEEPNLHFTTHDMRDPFGSNCFDYVFNFFTSFGYFKNNEDNHQVIRNICHSLKPGGVLVLDYLNVNYSEDNQVDNEEKEIDGIIYHITRWNDTTHFYKLIEIDNIQAEGKFEYMEKVEKLRLVDFDILFKRNGLKLKKVFGDYSLNEYDPEYSPRLIMVVEKD